MLRESIIGGMKYVALLRGIGPGNPNMRNNKLCGVLERLGHKNVRAVISSGNVVFESERGDVATIETEIQEAWPQKLGFESTTVVKSQEQLQELVDFDPFNGLQHSSNSYLLVTFFKEPTKVTFDFPYQPEGKTYKFTGATKDTLFSVTDNTLVKTTDLMTWMEKQFGKQITSRTWKTVDRIYQKMK